MDAGLDQNEAELRVLVLAVGLEVLAHGDGLFHEVPEILRDLWCQTCVYNSLSFGDRGLSMGLALTARLEDTEDLVTSNEAHLGNTVRVTEGNTDLRGGQALASELGNVLDDILGGGLEPGRRGAAVGEGRGR